MSSHVSPLALCCCIRMEPWKVARQLCSCGWSLERWPQPRVILLSHSLDHLSLELDSPWESVSSLYLERICLTLNTLEAKWETGLRTLNIQYLSFLFLPRLWCTHNCACCNIIVLLPARSRHPQLFLVVTESPVQYPRSEDLGSGCSHTYCYFTSPSVPRSLLLLKVCSATRTLASGKFCFS